MVRYLYDLQWVYGAFSDMHYDRFMQKINQNLIFLVEDQNI